MTQHPVHVYRSTWKHQVPQDILPSSMYPGLQMHSHQYGIGRNKLMDFSCAVILHESSTVIVK